MVISSGLLCDGWWNIGWNIERSVLAIFSVAGVSVCEKKPRKWLHVSKYCKRIKGVAKYHREGMETYVEWNSSTGAM